ncbi:hypothetical protein [Nocardia lijiangensis]|uniref:hypothetical protein n=1 Tax=Nocardia lijiangensis TaxID=299618 RepID=UPI00082C7190|nr:hypothetical protein [Nocardia lijiangensis]
MGYVYGFRHGTENLFEIGQTTATPERHKATLQTNCIHPLSLFDAIETDEYEALGKYVEDTWADRRGEEGGSEIYRLTEDEAAQLFAQCWAWLTEELPKLRQVEQLEDVEPETTVLPREQTAERLRQPWIELRDQERDLRAACDCVTTEKLLVETELELSADLLLDELHPVPGASLRGQLRDNPSIGPAPALTWLLEIPGWPDGNSAVNVMIDRIPLNVPSWRELEGAQVECTEADEPIAAYAYDGCWFQFEYVRIQVLRQVGTVARFAIELDYSDEMFWIELADGEKFETDRLCAIVDVEFEGIRVELDADRQLAEFTDPADLVFDAASDLYRPVVEPAQRERP